MRIRSVDIKIMATVLASLQATAVVAQESTATEQSTERQGKVSLEEIIVTAQRREQRLIDVPLSVQAQSGEDLIAAGVTDARGLEQIAPALSFSGSFSTVSTSFSMRGVQSLVDDAAVQPSVGVVIDNVPVARQAEVVLELADIDRVEVLSGPQGTLFGKNATSGVINIISKRPTQEFEASSEVSATSDEEVIAKGVVNIPLSEKLAARINGYYDHLSPLNENLSAGGRDEFRKEAWGVSAKLLFDITTGTNLLLGATYRDFDGGVSPGHVIVPSSGPVGAIERQNLGRAIGQGVDEINQDTKTVNEGDSQSFTAELNSEFSDSLSLVAISGYRKFEVRFGPDTDLNPTGVNKGRGYSPNPYNYPIEFIARDVPSLFEYKYFSQEVRLNYAGDRINAVGGVYYHAYDESQFKQTAGFMLDGTFLGLTPTFGTRFYVDNFVNMDIDNDTAAAFGDVTFKLTPTVNLFGGLRYTREKLALAYSRVNFFNPADGFFDPITYVNTAPPLAVTEFGKNDANRTDEDVSGRAGIQWQPQPNLNYYASFSRGYKGAAANGSQQITGPQNVLFDPEEAQAIEIGAKQRFLDGVLAIDLALYTQTVKNIQQTAVPPGTVFPSLVNAGDLDTDGFDLNVTGRVIDGLTLTGGVVYNEAKYSGNYSYPCGPSATAGVGSCRADRTISLDGTVAIGVPKWKVVTSATYERDLTSALKLTTRLAYNWRSKIQYQLEHDPLTEQGSYGLLDASIGVGSADGRWEATLFGKNLTDKFYYAYFYTADGFIGQSFGYLSRDYKRYGGLRLNYNF